MVRLVTSAEERSEAGRGLGERLGVEGVILVPPFLAEGDRGLKGSRGSPGSLGTK